MGMSISLLIGRATYYAGLAKACNILLFFCTVHGAEISLHGPQKVVNLNLVLAPYVIGFSF